MGLGQRRPGLLGQQVPRHLHLAEQGRAAAVDGQSAPQRLGLVGAAQREADDQPLVAQAGQLAQHLGVVEHATVERSRVNLIELQVVAQPVAAFAHLPAQDGQAVVFDLVFVGRHLPAGGVGVAPLGADDHLARRDAPRAQPVAQELLGAAVGAGGVEVADAGGPGGVEHAVGVGGHGCDVGVVAQVGGVAQIDVARPAQRGQPQAHRRYGKACVTQSLLIHDVPLGWEAVY